MDVIEIPWIGTLKMMDIKWTDDCGAEHTISHENAVLILQEYFNAWPCGLDEIEAAIDGWRARAKRMERMLRDICSLNMNAVAMELSNQVLKQHLIAINKSIMAGFIDEQTLLTPAFE